MSNFTQSKMQVVRIGDKVDFSSDIYNEIRFKVKQLGIYADEIQALVFSENEYNLEKYRERFLPDLEEIILLATELRIKYRINSTLDEEEIRS